VTVWTYRIESNSDAEGVESPEIDNAFFVQGTRPRATALLRRTSGLIPTGSTIP